MGDVSFNPNKVQPTVMEKISAQHKVEKEKGTSVLTHINRKVALVIGTILLAPLIPIAAAYGAVVTLREKHKVAHKPNSFIAVNKNMKRQEETDKFKTMKNVLSEIKSIQNLSPAEGAKKLTENVKDKLQDPQVEQERGARHILRALSQRENFNPEWIKVLSDRQMLAELSFDETGIYPESFDFEIMSKYPQLNMDDIRSLDWKKISRNAKKETVSSDKIDKETKKFEASLKHLIKVLNKPVPKDPTDANREIIKTMRECLRSPVYQALKHDASDPSVKLLQRMASDIWNKAPSMDAYRDVGTSIMETTKIADDGEELQGQLVAQQLEEAHTKMTKIHYTAHGVGGQLNYAITHPVQTLGGLASEGGAARHIPGAVGMDVYDSHGTLSNNPSLQGTTALELKNGTKGEIHNCYGGSPTIGDHDISPEFEAAIQAAENNQLAPPNLRDKNIPMMVNYNNLQNIHRKHGEGPRSRAIMLLNKKYPLSFRGATFSKDSAFYLMPKKDDVKWTGSAKDFGQKMQAQLEKSFDPEATDHGFYFHGPLQKWQPIFSAIMDNANRHFEGLQKDQPELWNALEPRDLQGAYQEYVYSLLNGVIEMESIRTLAERGVQDPMVMVISACKENIDRGGMENTKYLYNRLGETDQEDRLPLIIGAMHSRALSTRDRLILKSRMPQILNYMKTTSPETFKANMKELLDTLNFQVTKSDYRPFLSQTPPTAAPAA